MTRPSRGNPTAPPNRRSRKRRTRCPARMTAPSSSRVSEFLNLFIYLLCMTPTRHVHACTSEKFSSKSFPLYDWDTPQDPPGLSNFSHWLFDFACLGSERRRRHMPQEVWFGIFIVVSDSCGHAWPARPKIALIVDVYVVQGRRRSRLIRSPAGCRLSGFYLQRLLLTPHYFTPACARSLASQKRTK